MILTKRNCNPLKGPVLRHSDRRERQDRMMKSLLPVAAATAILAFAASTACLGSDAYVKAAPLSRCTHVPPASSNQTAPVDLSGSGLVFDPDAHKVRPAEPSENGAYPVIKEMPASPYPEVPSTASQSTNGESRAKDPSCHP